MTLWKEFLERLLSAQTARFILALLALVLAAFGANKLLNAESGAQESQAAIFAVGQLFALATLAFGYYFGSTAKRDDEPPKVEIDQPPDEPIPVETRRKK